MVERTMTKQEEIREKVARLIDNAQDEILHPWLSNEVADMVLEYLHSQGAFLKVPKPGRQVLLTDWDLEPLIEEGE